MIDWDQIDRWEEGAKMALIGYVPDLQNGKSGVTIACGVDLGQMYSNLNLVGLQKDIAEQVRPYLGLKGALALATIKAKPLILTEDEAVTLRDWKRAQMTHDLSSHFMRDAQVYFTKIPDAAQTVLQSVQWQYGTPWARTPHFWGHACQQDWPSVIHDLRNFGDAYKTRRNSEADYLKTNLVGT